MIKRIALLLVLPLIVLAACGQDAATPAATTAPAVEATEAPPTDMPATDIPPTEAAAAAETTQEAEAPPAPGAMVAEMDHQPDPELADITWEWVRRDPNGNGGPEIVVPNPENYTLTFNEDGTFAAMLDCNNGAGVYATPSPGSIFMELGPMTLAACPEESYADSMTTIFGGAVQNYRIEEDGQVLVLVWAAGGPLDYYRDADAAQPGEEEVNSIPADAIQLDLNGLAESYEWQVMPGSPIPPGPGGQGFPPHILLTFDGASPEEAMLPGEPRLYIFPTEAYVNLYQAEGNQNVADQVIRLGQLIATADGRSAPPESPMPLLPPPNSLMNRWAQFQDLDFGAGEGVRYVSDSPSRQAIGVWSNETTGYYYQGLSTDQTFYVSLYWPVSTSALPDTEADASEEQIAAATDPETNVAYQQETIAALNALAPADWSPDLLQLDAMAASLTFPLPGEGAAGDETGSETEETEAGSDEDEAAESEATATPAAAPVDGPSGTITAPDGVFVRSGPGTEYPDIDVAANGATVEIVGRSEDGQWWAITVPVFLAEDEIGWVSADWVDASDTATVPVIEASDVEAAQPALTGVTWQWLSTTTPVEQTTVGDPTRYTVTFDAGGNAAIVADCNNVAASYTADGGSINITPGPSTRAACGEASRDQQFLAQLEAAALYFFQEGDLFMDLAADGGTMRFTAGDAPSPAPAATATPVVEGPTASAQNIPFSLVSFGPEGAEQSPLEGTSITATFSGDTVSGSAGCNDYTGVVTPVDDYFTIGSVAVTAQECTEPAGVMEQEQAYLAALQGTAGYQWQQANAGNGVVTGGRLFYTLPDGSSGYLNFVAQ